MRRGEVAQADGTTIAYDVAGDGPPVVFLHGLTNRRQAWDPVTALLASRFTCVRLDFRGHGESSAAPDYNLALCVGDVRAVVEELSLGEPALVGHSLGASAAAVYAATHGVRAVVCVDESLRWGDTAERLQPLAPGLRGERPMGGRARHAAAAADRGQRGPAAAGRRPAALPPRLAAAGRLRRMAHRARTAGPRRGVGRDGPPAPPRLGPGPPVSDDGRQATAATPGGGSSEARQAMSASGS